MDKLTSRIKQSARKRFKKLSRRTPNGPEPSTALNAGQGTNNLIAAVTGPQPALDQSIPSRPQPTVPALHPEPNDTAQPPVAPITPAPPITQATAHDGWLGLRACARVMGELSEPFTPLKQAVGGILEVAETSGLAGQNREDFQKLQTELDSLLHDLAGHFGCDTPPAMTSSIVNLAQGIERELAVIRRKQHRGGAEGYISAEIDANKILEHYRNVQGLLQRLTLNANMQMWKAISEQAMNNRLKELPNSPAAKYRSAKSSVVLRGGCTPNTRVQVLADLDEWARDSKSPRIYWLNGMAGTGKTTIAYSFCRKLDNSCELAASFFCSRQLEGCHDVDQIVPTISYQLSHFSLPFRTAVSQVLENDSDVHNQPLQDQFRQLIFDPLDKSKGALPTNLVVVVDALDECEGSRGADVLEALLTYARDLPVKFFVASRPDAKILDLMRIQRGKETPQELRLHDLDESIVSGDIRTYLHVKIASPKTRISASDLETLVERSGILFIYAATVVRYIGYDNFSRAEKRLKEVLDSAKSGSRSNSDKAINALYTAILAAAFENPGLNESDRTEAKQVLHTVICAQEPLSIEVVAGMLGLERETVKAALRPLLSVLQVSDTTEIITTLHESFPDYLLDQTRSGEFHCDAKEQHARLTRICFDQISIPDPPFNICGLESSYAFDKEVPGLPARVERNISRGLRYACHYWGAHIMLAGGSEDLALMLLSFLSERFLLWMEVTNLCEYIFDGVRRLQRMQRWASNSGWLEENTKGLLRDAWMFAASYSSSPARHATPHIYVSALMFWPDYGLMSEFYGQESSKVIASASTAMSMRSAIPLSVQQTGDSISGVSYSPDGAYIVSSGCYDKTIRIWDAHTGQPVGQPLEGHTSAVESAAYSPDGAYIVSGSQDNTIRIWDARTSHLVQQPLEGHTSSVSSVAYSPDGVYIVSGSWDKTIRIWDAHTGQPVGQPLEGHTAEVHSAAYSPDGAYIVSGSWDHTIRIWDARTHQPVGQPLEGHTSYVSSVAYSPDGAYIVSGSADSIIRIWDARTREPVGQPLEGHTDYVNSVAYSPDGAYIVSGSSDRTIRLWDAHARHSAGQPLQGHTDYVESVAYSPDGAYIVSGSHDSTICIWDTQTSQPVGKPLERHTSDVNSVAYSPDGTYIASGSLDNSIRIWDARTLQPVGQPLKGHTDRVTSVACSPDGGCVVSSSYDQNLRIWGVRTGEPVGQPLEGHTGYVSSVAYSPDGAYIVSGSSDNTIRIWDTQTRQPVGHPLEGHTSDVNSVAYSPDGACIVSGSSDSTIRMWDAHTRQPVGQPLQGHTRIVASVAYSPDNAYIVSGSWDDTIRIWDARTGQPVGQPLGGHTNCVESVAYSPDGIYIASASEDYTVRIWDMRLVVPAGDAQDQSQITNPLPIPSEAQSNSRRPLCNMGCLVHCPHMAWTLLEDGWIVYNSDKLIWVPPDLRITLALPQNTAVLYRRGFLLLDLDRNKLGDHWCENFRPRKPTSS